MPDFAALRLCGFKSFVDPAELRIEAGLTGIVGPNGCGKSNLVEALRWVMAETSARAMRGGEMEDVIFAGTASRPARHVAEVSVELTTGGQAPPPWHDADPLVVSRRIERTRGSVYRVNGREVRARDVQLLFADAATGARSTAIVSQGQIGSLIAARPRERRLLLEEAAGITGLHARRHEAELRLNSAAANLERVEDVLITLEGQLKVLRKQARQAARYRAVAAEIRALEAQVLLARWQRARAAAKAAADALGAAEAVVAERTRVATAATTGQVAAAAALPGLRRRDTECAAEVQRLRHALADLDAEARRVEAEQDMNRSRLTEATADAAREQALVAEAGTTLARLGEDRDRLAARGSGEPAARAAAEAALADASRAVVDLDQRIAALTARIAAADAERSAREARRRDLATRVSRLAERAGDIDRQRRALAAGAVDGEAVTALVASARDAETVLKLARARLEAADAEAVSAGEAATAATAARQAAEADVLRWRAEETALIRLLADDGDNHAGKRRTCSRPVADALTVAPGAETALAAALGDDLLALLRTGQPADATAEPARQWRELPAMPLPPLPDGTRPLAASVDGPPALAHRLHCVGVVSTAEEAERLQPLLRPGQRLVTPEGGMWRWDGFSADRTAVASVAASRLEHRNRLTDVRKRLGAATEAAAAAISAAETATKTAAAARAGVEQARAALRDAEAAERKAREAAAAAAAEAARIAARQAALEDQASALSTEQAELERERQAAEEAVRVAPASGDEAAELARLRAELDRRRAAEAEARAALEAVHREAVARQRRLEALARDEISWGERLAAARDRLTALRDRRTAAEAALAALDEWPAALARRRETGLTELEAAEAAHAAAADQLATAGEALTDAERQARAAEAALAAAREDQVRAEAARDQARSALIAIRERIVAALGEAPDESDGADPGGDTPADPATLEARLDALRRNRDQIGPVNLCAEDEACDLERQVEALTGERQDLSDAIAKLRQGVAELNREGRQRLRDSFEAVDSRFRALFTRVFNGGRAHLALTESDDPLEAGLEIVASPPGKRPQALSLLSGGEQALATLALIFAVFKSNPAPVCVLDEVDAPLDDANVDRFCAVLEDLAGEAGTRFLVITHHRMTMARMDRLFGVTMAEQGISQLVSVDLRRAEALRRTA